ncbi:MAG TPA: hypothetical protein VJP05_01300 [Acidimicrobiia bacterium]|nr:hypothetical protein [Acidimicrobiia bacterium]
MAGLLVLPASASGQTGEIAFPPGIWEGSAFFNGTYETAGVRADGSSYENVRRVTASSINFKELVANEKGEVIDGDMEVDISWVDDGTGTTIAFGAVHPYHVRHEHRQTGSLAMTGSARRLVAAGTLDWETQTYSDGDLVEEVSGVEPVEVEWVFSASEANCATVTGRLVEATGVSLMATVLLPQIVFEEDLEAFNELVSLFWAWPQLGDPQVIKEAVEEVTIAANEALDGPPTVEDILLLVRAVEALRLELARLDVCQIPLEGFVPQFSDSWLAFILRDALAAALELVGEYTPQELIALLNAGVRGQAVDDDLHRRFGDALGQALDKAIEEEDVDTIRDIATAAGRYGYSDLYKDAVAALPEEPG